MARNTAAHIAPRCRQVLKSASVATLAADDRCIEWWTSAWRLCTPGMLLELPSRPLGPGEQLLVSSEAYATDLTISGTT